MAVDAVVSIASDLLPKLDSNDCITGDTGDTVDTVLASYRMLAEGGANIVYKLDSLNSEDEKYAPLRNCVLRVRKSVDDTTTKQIANCFNGLISKVLEPKFLVELKLVHLTEDFIDSLNLDLHQLELSGWRSTKHVGARVKPDAWGLLLTDMTSDGTLGKGGGGAYAIEFKPKWLSQSPNAPPFSRRCRTCALRAQREFEKRGSEKQSKGQSNEPGAAEAGAAKATFCPLALLSDDRATLAMIARSLFATTDYAAVDLQDQHLNFFTARFVDFFTGQGDGLRLLRRLQFLQQRMDPYGILATGIGPHPEHITLIDMKRFQLAMTLRDCSLLMKIPLSAAEPVEARLADLDLKSSKAKWEEWRLKERSLRIGGWYTCREEDGEGTGGEDVCVLNEVEWWV
ncbi:Inositol-pentakisphosphate 2-kinase [Coniosporium apollinis]|uniref:Inositol-pentakisphosphate 2-kinase n=1 Tax=Coniosporium apollinis TaxID=61459 RepID=A0ABQ9NW03_9PEZI|nr:Inositol-pentakisphosphate 2-kinase [Coniosporium apollinis]